MNNRELAIEIYKHPLIQQIYKLDLAPHSVVNKLIAEEVINELSRVEPIDVLKKTLERMPDDVTDQQIIKYVQNPENKIAVRNILNAVKEVGLDNPYSGLDDDEVALLKRFTAAAEAQKPASSDAEGINDVISEWLKSTIAEKIAIPLEKIVARIPGLGALSGLAQLAGFKAEEELIKKLLFPIDYMVDSLWKGIGAQELESLINDIMGDGVYKKLINAQDTPARLKILGSLDYTKMIRELLKELQSSQNPDIKKKWTELVNFKVGDYEVGRYFLKAILGDVPDAPEEKPENNKEEEDVEQAVEEANPEEDFSDNSPNTTREQYEDAIFDEMDVFYGQTSKPSFMKQLLLKDQGQMLSSLITKLNNIKTGDFSGEERALTDVQESLETIKENVKEFEFSNKEKVTLKRELSALGDLLRRAKKLADDYNLYATRTSADIQYDGSSLKKSLDVLLFYVQEHTARLIQIMVNIHRKNKAEMIKEDESMSREDKVAKVRQFFNKTGNLYVKSLKVSMKRRDDDKSRQVADEMIDLAKEIVPFFPRTRLTNSGKIISLDQAIKTLSTRIDQYAVTLRNIFMTVRDQSVAPTNITSAIIDLLAISEVIEDNFGVSSMVSNKTKRAMKAIIRPSDESLTPIPVEVEEYPEEEPEPNLRQNNPEEIGDKQKPTVRKQEPKAKPPNSASGKQEPKAKPPKNRPATRRMQQRAKQRLNKRAGRVVTKRESLEKKIENIIEVILQEEHG